MIMLYALACIPAWRIARHMFLWWLNFDLKQARRWRTVLNSIYPVHSVYDNMYRQLSLITLIATIFNSINALRRLFFNIHVSSLRTGSTSGFSVFTYFQKKWGFVQVQILTTCLIFGVQTWWIANWATHRDNRNIYEESHRKSKGTFYHVKSASLLTKDKFGQKWNKKVSDATIL